jgi:hypothetical protein
MLWTREMAKAMLKLRAVCLSGDWDSHWKWRVEQDQLRLYRKASWRLVRK